MAGLIGILIVVALGGFFYIISVGSRRTYHCPECGESIRAEHMEARRCNLCGAPLECLETRE